MSGRCLKIVFSAGLCAALLGAMSTVTCAETKEDIVNRMAQRLDAIKKHKADGKIGETFAGLVEAVKAQYLGEKDLKKLVDDENADRKKFYALGAEKLGVTPESFALSAGKRNFREAKPNEWLKPKGGTWVQKKDLKD